MAVTESRRHHLYELTRDRLDESAAETLFDMLAAIDTSGLATKSDVTELRADLERYVTKADLAMLQTDLSSEIGRLEARVDVMASDLRAEMHQSIRNQTWALVTFVAALNAVLMAVCTVVVATLG